ncbi:MAG: GNAT family protein [Thermoanaerobaculia bacterium]
MKDRAVAASGARVLLCEPEATDADELFALICASLDFLHPWSYPPHDLETCAEYLRNLSGERHRGWLLCRRSDGAILGVIRLTEIVRGVFQSGYLGFYLGAPYSGRGYMSEGLALVLGVAFRRMKLHRLEANIQPGNRRSIALVRRLGFKKEGLSRRYLKIGGRWRDHERWAILKEEWIGKTAVTRVGTTPARKIRRS